MSPADNVLKIIEGRRDDLVELAQALIRFPTVNPPGEAYRPCAEFIGRRLSNRGFAVEYVRAVGTPGDCERYRISKRFHGSILCGDGARMVRCSDVVQVETKTMITTVQTRMIRTPITRIPIR